MVPHSTTDPIPNPSPARISFSTDFLDDTNFISICPDHHRTSELQKTARNPDFEFLSGNLQTTEMMSSADELFSEGKLLPFRRLPHPDADIEKLDRIKTTDCNNNDNNNNNNNNNNNGKEEEEGRIGWFLDDDPSPRPPKCTVLWKELLRLKKQRFAAASSPSPAPSGDQIRPTAGEDNKALKRVKKGLERNRSASVRIRPVIHVPVVCTQGGKSSAGNANGLLPPLFSLRRSSGASKLADIN